MQPSGSRLDAWTSPIHFEMVLFYAVPDSRWAIGAHRVDALPRPNSMSYASGGTSVSPAGVRTIWLHHDLETFSKRLDALSARVAQDGLILTEDHVRALEKTRKRRKLIGRSRPSILAISAHRIPTALARLKGDGRIYQQTLVDTYSKVAIVKLYDPQHAITAADALNDRVLPFFRSGVLMTSVLRRASFQTLEFC